MEIKPLGDKGVLISFGHVLRESVHREIQQFVSRLASAKIRGIIEWVPAYNAVAIYYQPEIIRYPKLIERIHQLHNMTNSDRSFSPIVYEIPVLYGGAAGPDLAFVASRHGISEEKVIELHCRQEYLIYMMGFVPGFPYLGGLSSKLAVPRLEHPRPKVPEGSVGIGGVQTGIYPAEVPSGWRIIARTPVRLFDVNQASPVLLSAGNYIKFYQINREEYMEINQLVIEHRFTVRTYKKEDK